MRERLAIAELVPISLWLSTKIIFEPFAEREPLTGRGRLMTGNKQVIRWVLLAQAGDQEALNELFKAIQHQLYRYIVTLVGEPSLAEDILQEVFIQIFRKLRWLREPELLRPWVYRIATREAFRWLKKKRRWMQRVSDDADLEVIQALPTRENFPRELVEKLPQLLDRVSPASRAVLILHYWQEMSLEETADVLGVAVGTAKSRLAYGLDCLRRTLREQGVNHGRENQRGSSSACDFGSHPSE